MRRIVSLLLLLALWPLGCGQSVNPASASPALPAVRVLLLEDRDKVMLAVSEPPTISIDGKSRQRLNCPAGVLPVTRLSNGWQLGTVLFHNPGQLTIEPGSAGTVTVLTGAAAGKPSPAYRGSLRFVPTDRGRIDLVNDVDIEGYLKGVLACELFPKWPDETYKAQAIVARTYALYEARTGSLGRSFDLYSDQRSQVYGGMKAETAKSREAVDATRGIVVAYGEAGHEKIFKAYFSACCGGITQSASDAFGDPATPPLSDQHIGPRCADSSKFNWGPVVIRKEELTRRMRLWGAQHAQPEATIGDIRRVDVQFSNRWGRPTRFVVSDSRGLAYSLSGEDFRIAFNTSATDGMTLPSSFFKPVNQPSAIAITEGHGYGHGVGLCQWCAQDEAKAGATAAQIVVSAYPQSKLIRAY